MLVLYVWQLAASYADLIVTYFDRKVQPYIYQLERWPLDLSTLSLRSLNDFFFHFVLCDTRSVFTFQPCDVEHGACCFWQVTQVYAYMVLASVNVSLHYSPSLVYIAETYEGFFSVDNVV